MLTCARGHEVLVSVAVVARLNEDGTVSFNRESGDCAAYCAGAHCEAPIDADAARRHEARALQAVVQDLVDGGAIRACRVCGCTEAYACDPPCSWTEVDLCSSCAPAPLAVAS